MGGLGYSNPPPPHPSQPPSPRRREGGSMVCPASDIAGTSKIYTESGFSGASGHFLLHTHPACLSPIKIPTMPQICSTCLFDHQICPEIPQTSFLLTYFSSILGLNSSFFQLCFGNSIKISMAIDSTKIPTCLLLRRSSFCQIFFIQSMEPHK